MSCYLLHTLTRTRAKHLTALAIFLSFGIGPLIPWFTIIGDPFLLRPASCDTYSSWSGVLGAEKNWQSPGVQGLFTIDRTFGSFPFWLVKLIDVVWDLFVGRGLQWLAGWVSYIVFSSVLLRTIEESQIPFRTFLKLSTEAPSLTSIWFLLKDMPRFSRTRLILRFSYIVLASSYVLAMPTLLSAVTGYMSISTSFTKLPGSDALVHSSDLSEGMSVIGGLPGWPNGTCIPAERGVFGMPRTRIAWCQFEPLPMSVCVTEKLQALRAVGRATPREAIIAPNIVRKPDIPSSSL
ncbi:hypothetical protein HDK77DRAFT_379466 [Phyllosticta capitalensis]